MNSTYDLDLIISASIANVDVKDSSMLPWNWFNFELLLSPGIGGGGRELYLYSFEKDYRSATTDHIWRENKIQYTYDTGLVTAIQSSSTTSDCVLFTGGTRVNSSLISCIIFPRLLWVVQLFTCNFSGHVTTFDSIHGCLKSVGVMVMTGGFWGNSAGKLMRRAMSRLPEEKGNSYCFSGVSSLMWSLYVKSDVICFRNLQAPLISLYKTKMLDYLKRPYCSCCCEGSGVCDLEDFRPVEPHILSKYKVLSNQMLRWGDLVRWRTFNVFPPWHSDVMNNCNTDCLYTHRKS